MLSKILGPKMIDRDISLRPKDELCQQTEGVVELMNKRRQKFYGHFIANGQKQADQSQPKAIFGFLRLRNTESKQIQKITIDFTQMELKEKDLMDGCNFRNRVKKFKSYRIHRQNRQRENIVHGSAEDQ